MLVKRTLIVLVFAGVMLAFGGCRPSLIGSDSAVYSMGTLYAVTSQDTTVVYGAAQKTLADLEIEVTEKVKDAFYAKVVGTSADDRTITIKIKPGKDNLTDFSIRVGPAGNQKRSRVIYERLQQNLKSGSK
jgi:hypothetical protein